MYYNMVYDLTNCFACLYNEQNEMMDSMGTNDVINLSRNSSKRQYPDSLSNGSTREQREQLAQSLSLSQLTAAGDLDSDHLLVSHIFIRKCFIYLLFL